MYCKYNPSDSKKDEIRGFFMRIQKIICICILLLGIVSIQAQNSSIPELTKSIETLWKNKNYRDFLPILDERVRLNLGDTRGIYYPEHAIGILKKYFSEITIISFKPIEQRTQDYIVAQCVYQNVATGKVRNVFIYYHLNSRGTYQYEPSKYYISIIQEVDVDYGK